MCFHIKVSDVLSRDFCSFQLKFNKNNAYKISIKENKNKQLGQNDIIGNCLLINIQC